MKTERNPQRQYVKTRLYRVDYTNNDPHDLFHPLITAEAGRKFDLYIKELLPYSHLQDL